MKLAVSLSLTGDGTRYLVGAQRNLVEIPLHYPGATIILHHDETVAGDILQHYRDAGATLRQWPKNESLECHFWRFESVGNPDFDVVVCRDIDSVPIAREARAVEEWLANGGGIHVMRDHKWHADGPEPMMGGMWGATRGALPYDFPGLVRWWVDQKRPFKRWADCWFLKRFVYPYALTHGTVHDGCGSRWGGKPFPTPRIADEYVGAYIDC